VRQRVQRTGFAELRNAFLRFGGPLTAQFLQLDKEIERFAGQFMMQIGRPVISTTSVSTPGCRKQLERIEQQAIMLRDKAAEGISPAATSWATT
jgi:hypothetical protein